MTNNSRGEIAYTMLDLDTPITTEGLAALRAVKGVIRATVYN
jgi:hypothetical protein